MIEQARIAPFINVVFTVTSAQPYRTDGTLHGGLDISTGNNDPLYSMVEGTVLYSQYNTGGWGNMIIMRDDTTGDAFLYGHMTTVSPKRVGDHVSIGEFVGYEGNTGQSTGIHLHVEWQNIGPTGSWNWNVPVLDRPHVADFMGISNVYGTRAIYDGTPVPPTPSNIKNKFPWVLYARKIRERTKH